MFTIAVGRVAAFAGRGLIVAEGAAIFVVALARGSAFFVRLRQLVFGLALFHHAALGGLRRDVTRAASATTSARGASLITRVFGLRLDGVRGSRFIRASFVDDPSIVEPVRKCNALATVRGYWRPMASILRALRSDR
jgi:hypothetical protein